MRTSQAALALLLLPRCSEVEQSYSPAPAPDEALFAADVEPALESRCANPSCHGRSVRPLHLFAPRRFRADPTRLFLDEPLDGDELRTNYECCLGFVADGDAPEDSPLLRKPLGRAWHAPGPILTEDDPEARAIRDWLWSAE